MAVVHELPDMVPVHPHGLSNTSSRDHTESVDSQSIVSESGIFLRNRKLMQTVLPGWFSQLGFLCPSTILYPCLSHCFPMPSIHSPYTPLTLLIHSSYTPHTLLIHSSYETHTLFIQNSYTPHTPGYKNAGFG